MKQRTTEAKISQIKTKERLLLRLITVQNFCTQNLRGGELFEALFQRTGVRVVLVREHAKTPLASAIATLSVVFRPPLKAFSLNNRDPLQPEKYARFY